MKKFLLSMMAFAAFTASADVTMLDATSANGADGWTFENVTMPEGASAIWSWKNYSNAYYLNASAYISGSAQESESWAVSPVVDMTAASTVSASFEHAAKFQTTLTSLCKFAVRVAGTTTWTEVAIPTWPESGKWTWGESGAMDLSAFAGKKVQLGFKYGSTTSGADTWEIRNLAITGNVTVDGGSTPEPEVTEVDNLAAFLALAQGTTAKLKNPITAIYQNGRNLFVKDASGYALVYGDLGKTYENGMTIAAGATGKRDLYNGKDEFVPDASTFADGVAGTAVQPEELSIEELAADNQNVYIILKGVTVAAGADERNFTVTDASGSATLYNQFNQTVTVPTGDNMTVVAFTSVYSGNLQLLPVSVTNASGRETVAAPRFNPAAGAVEAGTEVAISCATEGATIYYTLDGTTPTTASTVYSTPIVVNNALTISAIAVKDGMDNSSVATAAYTIKEDVILPEGETATFDFTNPQALTANPALDFNKEASSDGTKTISAADVTFTSGAATVVISKGASTQGGAVYYSAAGAWSYRFYKKAVMTIAAGDNFVKGVEFTFSKAASNTEMAKCTFSDGAYADCVWAGETKSLTIDAADAGSTIQINAIKVVYGGQGGVNDITVDNNAPVEYYNLQGIRMNGDDLTPGLYIRRQGNTVNKVIVR